jgi:hypothetical protein
MSSPHGRASASEPTVAGVWGRSPQLQLGERALGLPKEPR